MRPESLKFPQIFYKFKAKDLNSDKIIEYRVQDLPEELFEDALHLFFENYFPDELMALSRKFHEKKFESNDLIKFWREAMKERLSLACFKNNGENDNELVAVNIHAIYSKNDKNEWKVNDQDIQDMFDSMSYAFSKVNLHEKYGVDKFLGSYGLVVSRKYRGRGIATKMFEARKCLVKALGLNLSSTFFSVIGSQKGAQNAGFVEDFVISYKDLAKVSPRFVFKEGLEGGVFKIMSFKF